MKEEKKMKKIFREAAQRIDAAESFYSCCALNNVLNQADPNLKRTRALVERYARIISPAERRAVMISDFRQGGRWAIRPPAEAREHRVIALLIVGEAWNDLKGEPWKEK